MNTPRLHNQPKNMGSWKVRTKGKGTRGKLRKECTECEVVGIPSANMSSLWLLCRVLGQLGVVGAEGTWTIHCQTFCFSSAFSSLSHPNSQPMHVSQLPNNASQNYNPQQGLSLSFGNGALEIALRSATVWELLFHNQSRKHNLFSTQ